MSSSSNISRLSLLSEKVHPLTAPALLIRVIVDPSSIATEVVIALLTVHALIVSLLTNDFNLIKQVVI